MDIERRHMMTAADIRGIIVSSEYKHDLEELSSYLASIKQERPMVYCLAKQIWRNGYKFQLEAKLKDLFVNGKHIEFKFNYDCDMERLSSELRRHEGKPYKERWDAAQEKKSSLGWSVALKIYEDICEKKPDVFVWIICSRDLSKVTVDDINRICWSTAQSKWSATHPYEDRAYLRVADSFLETLQTVRPFSILKEEIATNGAFPSIYHFRICDFASQRPPNDDFVRRMPPMNRDEPEAPPFDLVRQMPAEQKREMLLLLAKGPVDRAQRQQFAEDELRRLCAARGLDWDGLSAEAREAFIDDLVHEDR